MSKNFKIVLAVVFFPVTFLLAWLYIMGEMIVEIYDDFVKKRAED